LKENTDNACDKYRTCGVPTYVVGENVNWGQDRINVVRDLLLGWSQNQSKL